MTTCYEPIRPIYAPDDGTAYYQPDILGPGKRVHYGLSSWPSCSYWYVPGTLTND